MQGEVEAAVPSDLMDLQAYVPMPKSECTFRMVDGVIRVFSPPVEPLSPEYGDAHTVGSGRSSPAFNGDSARVLSGPAVVALPDAGAGIGTGEELEAFPLPGTDRDFFTDMLHLSRLSAAGPVMTYCHHRLTLLEQKFNLHVMLNAEKERLAQKTAPHRDLYNVRKVSTGLCAKLGSSDRWTAMPRPSRRCTTDCRSVLRSSGIVCSCGVGHTAGDALMKGRGAAICAGVLGLVQLLMLNVVQVDTHVHHSACMHQKHLLRFIKSKLKKEPDEIVIFRDGKFLTLLEVFESLNLTAYDLNVDTLDMHADKTIFHRFDRFNLKYNPFGQSRLREVFIKQVCIPLPTRQLRLGTGTTAQASVT